MKKTTTLLAAASLIGGLSMANADGDRTIGDGNIPAHVAEWDANGDGHLDQEEAEARRAARAETRAGRRAAIDTDGDGTISEEERNAAMDALRERIVQTRCERFDEANTDPGTEEDPSGLSFEEWSVIPAIARLAANRPEIAQAIFDRLDTDDDGEISKEEFLVHLRVRRDGANRPGGPDRPNPPEPPIPGDA